MQDMMCKKIEYNIKSLLLYNIKTLNKYGN